MNAKRKTVLVRGVRSLVAAAGAALAAYLAGPDVASVLTPGQETVVTMLIVPAILMFDKWVRYGSDPGEQ